jgi:hypothetical protein
MFIAHDERYRDEPIPQSLLDEMGEFVTDNLKSGVLIDTGGLEPTSKATRVRLSRGRIKVTDGPFTEAKEVIGGYALVRAHTDAEATELATKFMEIHRRTWPEFEGACEVRRIEEALTPDAHSAAASEAGSH